MNREFRKGIFDPSSVATDLKTLSKNAKTLNKLTDDLTQQVGQIESVINALNLGLSSFVVIEESPDMTGVWSHYTRLWYVRDDKSKWGLTIDEFDEHNQDPENCRNHKSWAFREAPRVLRLKAVGFIPDLLADLVKQSENMTTQTAATLAQAKDIAANLLKPALDGSEK